MTTLHFLHHASLHWSVLVDCLSDLGMLVTHCLITSCPSCHVTHSYAHAMMVLGWSATLRMSQAEHVRLEPLQVGHVIVIVAGLNLAAPVADCSCTTALKTFHG